MENKRIKLREFLTKVYVCNGCGTLHCVLSRSRGEDYFIATFHPQAFQNATNLGLLEVWYPDKGAPQATHKKCIRLTPKGERIRKSLHGDFT